MSEKRMEAYYYSFDPTGDEAIDTILSAVACAGTAYHHTDEWIDDAATPEHLKGKTPVEWIQNAASEAAHLISALTEERDSLKTKLEETQFFLREEMKKSADWYTAHEEMRDRADDAEEERDRYREEAARLREALAGLISDIDGLVEESGGVYGLHLNGDPAPWDEILPGGRYERLTFLDVAQMALSLSPLPEREAEREVLKAAEEWFSDWKDYGALSQTYQNLREAVRKLRSLREKG